MSVHQKALDAALADLIRAFEITCITKCDMLNYFQGHPTYSPMSSRVFELAWENARRRGLIYVQRVEQSCSACRTWHDGAEQWGWEYWHAGYALTDAGRRFLDIVRERPTHA